MRDVMAERDEAMYALMSLILFGSGQRYGSLKKKPSSLLLEIFVVKKFVAINFPFSVNKEF